MPKRNKPAASADAAGQEDALCRYAARKTKLASDRDQREALARAALDLARIGLPPVPAIAQDKRPALKGWRERARCDPQAVVDLFVDAPRADGLAIATGAGIFVLDLDRNHASGADGIRSFAALVGEHGAGEALALGPRVRTPRKGVHLYFRCDPGRVIRNRVGLASGVDVRGDGGLAMAPPSPGYKWVFGSHDLDLPMAPAWLLALIDPPAPMPASALWRTQAGYRSPIADLSAYAAAVFEREVAGVRNAKPSERNQTLYKASARLGSLAAAGMIPIEQLVGALYEGGIACGLVADDGEARVRATIASGLKRGLNNPRQFPERP